MPSIRSEHYPRESTNPLFANAKELSKSGRDSIRVAPFTYPIFSLFVDCVFGPTYILHTHARESARATIETKEYKIINSCLRYNETYLKKLFTRISRMFLIQDHSKPFFKKPNTTAACV